MMIFRPTSAVALLTVLAAGPAPATAPATAPAVAALIGQLDADDWPARDAAVDRLAAVGEPARAAVADAAAHARSPEVRSRATSVLARLDRAAAERPTAVTVHVKDGDVRDVLAAIGRQAGVSIGTGPEAAWAAGRRPRRVSVDLDGVAFWPALAAVCARADVGPTSAYTPDGLTIAPGGPADFLAGPRVTAGRVIVVTGGDVRHVPATWLDGPVPAGDVVPIKVFVDPHLRLFGQATVRLTAAADADGRSLMPADGSAAFMATGDGAGLLMFVAPLPVDLSHGAAAHAATITGTITGAAVGASARMQIDDAAAAGVVTRTVGRYRFTLLTCGVDGRRVFYTAHIRSAADEREADIDVDGIRLEDAAGRPIAGTVSTHSNGDNGDRMVGTSVAASAPVVGPVRLVWRVVTRRVPVTVPFAFHDARRPPPR